jgi:hypothetical protein
LNPPEPERIGEGDTALIYRYAIFLTLCSFLVVSQGRALFAEATPLEPNSLTTAVKAMNNGDSNADPTSATDVDDIQGNLSASEKATLEDMIQHSHGEPQRAPAVVDADE